MANMENDKFTKLKQRFDAAPVGIRNQIIDYSYLIEEKTSNFVGRQFVINAIEEFTENVPQGYFLITSDPGLGKTAIAAKLVKANGLVHHFNVRAEGINVPGSFLRNICCQLIAVYDLPYNTLPSDATGEPSFFYRVLSEISEKLGPTEKATLVIDALDEADSLGLPPNANVLHLPANLPNHVYIIATMRKSSLLPLAIECDRRVLTIENDSAANIADIQEYLQKASIQSHLRTLINESDIDANIFVDQLIRKSEGNFLYLHYMLREIVRYEDLNRINIPQGLNSYYENHWRLIRGQDEETWFEYKLPIITILAVVKEPISIDLISEFTRVKDKRLVRETLMQWAPFLREQNLQQRTGFQKRYGLYHSSFQDFIVSKEEIASERVDLRAAHAQIADSLWQELFGDE